MHVSMQSGDEAVKEDDASSAPSLARRTRARSRVYGMLVKPDRCVLVPTNTLLGNVYPEPWSATLFMHSSRISTKSVTLTMCNSRLILVFRSRRSQKSTIARTVGARGLAAMTLVMLTVVVCRVRFSTGIVAVVAAIGGGGGEVIHKRKTPFI